MILRNPESNAVAPAMAKANGIMSMVGNRGGLHIANAIREAVLSSLLPLLRAVVVPARHAYSHSASLGSRIPVELRKP
jgi:hypothetical protein